MDGFEVWSPNRRVRLVFGVEHGKMIYSLDGDERKIIGDSLLTMDLSGCDVFEKDLVLIGHEEREERSEWETVWGEEKTIVNHYNEAAFYLSSAGDDLRHVLTMRFRVFDEGVGFRYEFLDRDGREVVVKEELTEFNVDQNSAAWWIPAYQPDRYEYLFRKDMVAALDKPVHTPLTIKTTGGHYISIHEAALYDYGSMVIHRYGDTLRSEITPLADGMAAYVSFPFNTPWRVVMVAESAVELTLNRIVLNLNEPSAIEDTSWIRPTKYMGIWWAMHIGEWTWRTGEGHGATTERTKEYIDWCVRLGIPALLVEGWNEGWEGDWLENGPENKFAVAYPDFDIEEVTRYAKEKGVEMVGHHETEGFVDNYESQLPEAFEYYEKYGVKYVKLGYAGSKMLIGGKKEYHHSQVGVRHYQRVVEMAAERGMMLDIHEPIKGTGIERTWPNLMTREGARGQEYEGGGMTPEHHTMIPYTRMLAGPFDYTPGVFDIHSNGVKTLVSTVARQLALFVTIYSPLQMAADRPRYYEGNPAFKFVREVPVDFAKTVALMGEIGEYYVVARKDRNSENWCVGGVTNEEARTVSVALDFLDEDREYVAEVYADGESAHYRDNPHDVNRYEVRVRKGEKLEVRMVEGGGFGVMVWCV